MAAGGMDKALNDKYFGRLLQFRVVSIQLTTGNS